MGSRGCTNRCRRGVIAPKLAWLVAFMVLSGATTAAFAAPGDDAAPRVIAQGRELFIREWLPGDPGGHPGDGLGPMYNDTSCVACHNQGGVGGAGPASKNVDLVTAIVTPVEGEPGHSNDRFAARMRELNSKELALRGVQPPKVRAKGEAPDRGPLVKLHGGFHEATNLVVHRFGSDPRYEVRRLEILDPNMGLLRLEPPGLFGESQEVQALTASARHFVSPLPAEHGHFTLTHSQRNPAPLFGVGLIDAIPDAVLEAATREWDLRFPEIKGRVCRLENWRIGRFGWKAEQASLEDFVLTACAVELGLEVPGRHQGVKSDDPDYRPPGLDLGQAECDALAAFVRSLPAPDEGETATAPEALAIRTGREAFDRIGCAVCHRSKLGPVTGIYSDLLLHDMGDTLGSISSYGSELPDPAEESRSLADRQFPSGPDAFVGGPPPPRPAKQREWRTPPLWGVRDSGPYLHDGRADTLEQAIALHAGEARATRIRYFRLKAEERIGLQRFLKSLVAPAHGKNGPDPKPERPMLTSTFGR
jgi:CxxC motif-containing protein (DUF1111 family)